MAGSEVLQEWTGGQWLAGRLFRCAGHHGKQLSLSRATHSPLGPGKDRQTRETRPGLE